MWLLINNIYEKISRWLSRRNARVSRNKGKIAPSIAPSRACAWFENKRFDWPSVSFSDHWPIRMLGLFALFSSSRPALTISWVRDSPWFSSSAALEQSQLVCLESVGILNLSSSFQLFVSFLALKSPSGERSIKNVCMLACRLNCNR